MKVLYFSWVREKTGVSQEEVSLPDGVETVSQLVDSLRQRGEGYATAFSDPDMVRVAVNQDYVTMDHVISNNDEVAFFPPVTGG